MPSFATSSPNTTILKSALYNTLDDCVVDLRIISARSFPSAVYITTGDSAVAFLDAMALGFKTCSVTRYPFSVLSIPIHAVIARVFISRLLQHPVRTMVDSMIKMDNNLFNFIYHLNSGFSFWLEFT